MQFEYPSHEAARAGIAKAIAEFYAASYPQLAAQQQDAVTAAGRALGGILTISENTVWHLTRALHVAGRCTGCGECERVCPMNIQLMLLNKKILKDVKELFDYTPVISVDAKPLLAAYKPDDPEDCLI